MTLNRYSFVLTLLWTSWNLHAQSPTPPPQAASYGLVFDDEFNTLNTNVWYPGLWYSSSPPPASNYAISNGVLNLTWTKASGQSDTTLISVAHNGSNPTAFQYGYFEARMKWDVQLGEWPAFWMDPVEDIGGKAATAGEIDIFEGQGSDPSTFYGTLHNWSGSQALWSSSPNYAKLPLANDFSQWHTYGCLWTPGHVTWYFDNVPVLTSSIPASMDAQHYYLILSEKEGANWSDGNLSGVTATSMNLSVDWVHVFQAGAISPTPVPPVISSFSASPASLMPGQSSTLSFAVTGASSVALSGIGDVTGKSSVQVSPTTTTTYVLTARNSAGSVTTGSVTVSVTQPAPNPGPPVISSFSASPATITTGQSSTLSYSASGATSLSISGIGTVTGETQVTVSPAATTTYILTATNAKGSAKQNVTLQVSSSGRHRHH